MTTQKTQNTKFFFGCNTPVGFKGFLDSLYDPADGWQVLLIKGSPGSGKNTVMKKALAAMRLENEVCEEIYCSSDPASLDGVIVPGRKRAIFDATAPHVMEPRFWGACEVLLDLSACLDTGKLARQAEEVISLTAACAQQHKNCCTELSKAVFIQNSHYRNAEKHTDFDQILEAADQLAENLFADSPGLPCWEKNRFLSAVTPEGTVFFRETLETCDKVYTLYDPFGAFSSVFLSVLRNRAKKAGEPLISCYCPLAPDRVEHILFPRLQIGLTTLNDFHRYDSLLRADFSYTNFLKGEIPFLEQSCRSFIESAAACLKQAKSIHDQLEGIYSGAMDWECANAAAVRACSFLEQSL